MYVIPVSYERSHQALRHRFQDYTLEPLAAVAVVVAAGPMVAGDMAVSEVAVALQSLWCCLVSHIQADRSSASCLCSCLVRDSQLPGRSADREHSKSEGQGKTLRKCGVTGECYIWSVDTEKAADPCAR